MSFSHFDIACLDTFNLDAKSSWDKLFLILNSFILSPKVINRLRFSYCI